MNILDYIRRFLGFGTPTSAGGLITEVGFSYAQQLEQENASFAKNSRSRSVASTDESVEPDLAAYVKRQETERSVMLNTPKRGDSIEVVNLDGTPITPPTVTPPVVTPPLLPTLNLSDIVQENLVSGQYYREVYTKRQIYLHHTVSTGNPLSAINWWRKQNNGVATFMVIAGNQQLPSSQYHDGEMYQCFSSKYWAHHLGLKSTHLAAGGPSNLTLNRQSIGIELSSWGVLQRNTDGTFSPKGIPTATVPANQVQEYPSLYKGERYYQKYTNAQIESLRKLLVYLCDVYKIDRSYKGDQIFNVDNRALRGEKGIFTHTSVRPDKSDCHPQPELIAMLRNL